LTRTIEPFASGGTYFEAPRWHDGRWWVSDVFAGVVQSYMPDGAGEDVLQVKAGPSGLGWSADDGSLLVVATSDRQVLRRRPDGDVSVYADLANLCEYNLNDMVVAENGRAYVGTIGFAIAEGGAPQTGSIYVIDPDGAARVAADDLWCPNGMVITADGSTLIVSESFASRMTAFRIGPNGELGERREFARVGEPPTPASSAQMLSSAGLVPDGCTIDEQNHVWVADPMRQRVVRFSPDGEVVDQIADPEGRDIFACALGGSDGRTLLLCAAPDFFEAAVGQNAGQGVLLTTRVQVPHGGRP
jgi:sugar lactone lactonase YvrE